MFCFILFYFILFYFILLSFLYTNIVKKDYPLGKSSYCYCYCYSYSPFFSFSSLLFPSSSPSPSLPFFSSLLLLFPSLLFSSIYFILLKSASAGTRTRISTLEGWNSALRPQMLTLINIFFYILRQA